MIKNIIRASFIGVTLSMIAATVLDQALVTGFAAAHVYSAWWFCLLWAIMAVASFAYIAKSGMRKRPAPLLLHISFGVILAGALATHTMGEQGVMRIREGGETRQFVSDDGKLTDLPFAVSLNKFEIITYPGTDSPMDYVSHVSFRGEDGYSQDAQISMNNIATHMGYRFYQASYDPDRRGTLLSVSHDPVGIGVTYTGYAMLFISLLLLLIMPGETFRRNLKALNDRAKSAAAKTAVVALSLATWVNAEAQKIEVEADVTEVMPADVAARFGDLHAYYNGRVCPLQTVAKDFTMKLYGRDTYMGLTSEQVLMGWTLDAPRWAGVRMIRIKRAAAAELGMKETLVSYDDLANGDLPAKIRKAREEGGTSARALEEAEEKADVIRMLFAGQMLKVFPLADSARAVKWYSPADALPHSTGEATSSFVRDIFGRAADGIKTRDWETVGSVADRVAEFQRIAARGTGALPPASKFKAEKAYNKLGVTRPLAMTLTAVGIMFFFIVAYLWGQGITSRAMRIFTATLSALLGLVGAYLAAMFCLRWYVGGHLPLSNGYETMQFMSLCAIVCSLACTRRFALALPFGYLLSGLTMMVSMFGESNPQVTNLMPVLQSPLLSVHVCLVMISYSLLAFTALNGLAAIAMRAMPLRADTTGERIETLAAISRVLLTPAVACLAAGIFVGAIWANQSWGRYWGWDPKEVWALITMMVYAIPFHPTLSGRLGKAMALHIFLALAFACVLMTYFGVNYLLGGMHSYA